MGKKSNLEKIYEKETKSRTHVNLSAIASLDRSLANETCYLATLAARVLDDPSAYDRILLAITTELIWRLEEKD